MAVERKFVADGVRKVRVERHLGHELKRAGYGGMDLIRTPLGTQVTIFAEKPGIVIGKGGKVVRSLTQDLATTYGVESPQIEVQQVDNPNLNAQIMAERLASALERGWYFRKAGSSTLRRIMDSGALGCEVVISGKLTGARGRVQKFTEGYIKHSGDPVNTLVDKGYAVAIKKLGVIGVQVRLIPPGALLPDHFEVTAEVTKKQRNMAHITRISNDYEEEELDLDAIVDEPDEFMEEE
ncbi:30S ribosomal protein S3 [Methanospirillum sp. J.3.6.1-F.2.7.3]|uniref:Small ribosomal subunit protein uS3 n=2 Tax=Methanospirillum TaxID=2202 RepID=A0A8E7B1P6_9EURY|nr:MULTISPECIES: 30S ribosomal protein S3 [Methanospirillum]MDX8549047.1 30S ribosomal protein S3 [Methanospirillum hungatei]NLW74941.1 30S ribosomal protein S3 [Methanomicrobiales archaeon]QVV88731.1 30S ribosomal protein S3 [Methanospirillum sp. J.3.6.1-F.2.7.3]QXO93927.1 30S ribosomal protein S3 [Methanospirillum hungatei]